MPPQETKKFRVYHPSPASVTFRLLISELRHFDEDSHLLECSKCHRTHLTQIWKRGLNEREVERIEGMIQDCPQRFCILDSEDPIPVSRYSGEIIIIDCPCNITGRIESDLIKNQNFIEESPERMV
jgi:hypothetical protein